MSNLTYSKSDNLQNYLAFLDSTPLLTRKKESELLEKVAEERRFLFKECFKVGIFRSVMAREIFKLSRKTLTEVPKNYPLYGKIPVSVDEYRSLLVTEYSYLMSLGYPRERCLLKSSGNIASLVLDGILAKHSHMQSHIFLEQQVSNLGIRVDSFEDLSPYFPKLEALVRECLRNQEMRELLRKQTGAQSVSEFKQLLTRIEATLRDYAKNHRHASDRGEATALALLDTLITKSEVSVKPVTDLIINSNLRLVVARARYLPSSDLEFEDLIQYGNIGLLKALRKYDPEFNIKFATYATWWIDQALQRAVANRAKIIRVPTHVQVLLSRISKLRDLRVGEVFSEDELASELGVSESAVRIALDSSIVAVGVEAEGEDGMTLDLNSRQTDVEDNPFHITSERLARADLRKALRRLPPETEKILRLKYGIGEPYGRPKSRGEISSRLGISKKTVENKLRRGKRKLKRGALKYGIR